MCQSCNVINISGINCHETSCPDAWQGKSCKCKNCLEAFIPEEKNEIFCSVDCCNDYYGFSDEPEESEEIEQYATEEYISHLYELVAEDN